ncbi:type II secretion system protein M [Variovorax sp. PAMC28562]|jgi:general secretion pathway protein M|uniref:type II secretion system protein GspM n=1 Tax=Variovorax sp. PAMC28562 TaxID=2762323 RepID=UPI00164DE0D0|nr:type II secretion system protein GspM [Variovorax sp. PAMC28562]QNK75412.1 type II secretion system protein M [Variovorax sp. PAMC28562]
MTWFDSLNERWQAWWPDLPPREQRLVIIAATVVALALLWWVALAPALRTLASAPAEHAQLDAQLQQMTTLQTQARALQSQPRSNRDDALRALETSVRQSLGANAQLQTAGANEGVTVQVRAAPAEGLAQWFGQARSNARAVPREAHLTRAPGGGGATPGAFGQTGSPNAAASAAAAAEAARVRWDGTLVMSLPAR